MLQKKRKYGFENLEKTFRQTKQLAEQLFASVYEKNANLFYLRNVPFASSLVEDTL